MAVETIKHNGEEGLKAVDLTHLKPEYQGRWVVMSRSTREVFAVGKKPTQELISQATNSGCEDPILHKVVPFNRGIIF